MTILKIYQFISKFNTSKSNFNEDQFKYFLDGKLKILNLKISKVYEKKSFKGMIMSIDDVTELVAAQKNAAWSNVARYMAHEIKNPLTPIKLSAQRILNSLNVKDSDNKLFYKNCLNTIVRQVNNIEGLVTEFSNFARMPESKLELVNLNKIIESQIETQKIVKKDVNFSFINSKKKLSIMCDFNQINRLIMNILKNSTESLSKKKKEIIVSLQKKGKFVVIEFEDNGDGFPKVSRDKLFEPYFTQKINGTGLGLAICKKIVEDHNGEINLLDSPNLGGAMVRITLRDMR